MNIIRYGGPMSRTRKVGSPIGYSGRSGLTGFVSVWATTAINETITIPCQNVGTFNAVIDWGDGTPTSTITAYNDADLAHVYADIDDYTISITGVFPNIYFNGGGDKDKIKKILNLGTVGWTNFSNAFYACSNLVEFTVGSTDTSAVTRMDGMLGGCTLLTSVDLSTLNTSSVDRLFYMFLNCSSLTSVDVSNWNTSSVNQALGVFQGCSGLTSIVGVEDWAITGLNSTNDLNAFLTVGKMTTAQYDNLLVKWQSQDPFNGMTPSFGASTYTGGSAAATARQDLIDIDGWSISDGGIAP